MPNKVENLRIRLLSRWGEWACEHWGRALLMALAVTAVMAIGISMVRLEFTFYSILPKESRQVRDLEAIVENFPAASVIVVVLEAESKDDREEAAASVKAAADAVVEELSQPRYSQYIIRAEGKQDFDFFRDHGVMLTEADDIARMRSIYADLNFVPFFTHLNDDFEREYSGDEDKLSDDEDLVVSEMEGLERVLDLLAGSAKGEEASQEDVEEAVDFFLFGSSYYLNRDSTMALVLVQPAFTMNDMEPMVNGVKLIDGAVKDLAESMGVKAGLTGLLVVGKDEMVTSEKGLVLSMLIAIILILALMILVFRMYSVPFISGIPLITGILWTIGIVGFFMERLNIMSAMYLVALIGLGIDFAIHLLTAYVQEIEAGQEFVAAVRSSFRKSGSGVFVGALTTATAFFMLMISKTEAVKELGFVAGAGILCELLAMFLMVPALLGLRNYRLSRKGREGSRELLLNKLSIRSEFIPQLGAGINRHPVRFAVIMLAGGILLGTQAFNVRVEGNLMNMEAKGLESVELQDRMVAEFEMAPDSLSIISTDLEELRSLGKGIEDLASVKRVESLAPFIPSEEERAERILPAQLFQKQILGSEPTGGVDVEVLVDEIFRLEANLIEMSDLAYLAGMDKLLDKLNTITGRDEDGQKRTESIIDRLTDSLGSHATSKGNLVRLQALFVRSMRRALSRMANTAKIDLDTIPVNIRESYMSADGRNYLMVIVPTQNPWEEEFRALFKTQVETVTDRATGMVLAADQMTAIAGTDGIRAAVASLLGIFILLLLDFRNMKLAVVTVMPLVLSFLSLFGLMAIAGIKFDFVNIISVPLLIGIGIDDSVHFNHRYLLEGEGKMDLVVSKTGAAVLMTTLTTVIGFASFIPSVMRAMRSTGIVLSIAMSLAFLFSILFHPAVLVIMTERLGLNIQPWRMGLRRLKQKERE